ncbi:hypothetical protein [Myxococcus eversor]|uniref:hypothetical protein n=1 Tax=Myxococcus eversor TaxID=2709661 RepID=UPI0013CFDD3A|nr:hypothetical protein [Myxococcus eversor]
MTDVATQRGRDPAATGRRWWIAAGVTSGNVLTASGFAILGLVAPAVIAADGNDSASARVFAMYAAARTLPLAAAVLWNVLARSTRGLGVLAVVAGLMQACDALVGISMNDAGKTFGPAILAVATFVCARWLLRPEPRT